ncbi:MAG: endonuclease/exonuclease/phosphatase family protein [bacterium]|nr:endonuclease/exonuclease/phosphatase family protein [bacterium]
MSASLKLISLNIERAKHLDRVVPFLRGQKPDVACLQEVREPDIPLLKEAIGAVDHFFAPMTQHPSDGNPAIVGMCIISRLPVRKIHIEYYRGNQDSIPHAIERPEDWTDDVAVAASHNCALSSVDVEKDRAIFRISTTHFLWSRRGRFTKYQREDMKKLLAILAGLGEFVLTGDFNAPRGGEIFGMLAEKYKDNIPLRYVTSLDLELHRAAQKGRGDEIADKMVDGLFSTPAYIVSDVKMICGVSDHCAIVANVSKNTP